MDKAFLDEIRKRGFEEIGFSEEVMLYLLALAAAVALLLVLGNLFNILSARLAARRGPAGSIYRAKEVRTLLRQALDERRSMDMSFLPAEMNRRSIKCALEAFGKEGLTLELPTGLEPSRSWLDREVRCFFRVRHPDGEKELKPGKDQGQRFQYYMFHSYVVGLKRVAEKRMHATLAVPERIEPQQKRANLRVQPPEEYLLGLAVWLGQDLSVTAMLGPVRGWGKPSYLHTPPRPGAPQKLGVRVEDLSAGGMRLFVPHEAAKTHRAALSVGERLVCILDLYSPERQRKVRHLLTCRIQNIYEDFTKRDIELGIKFERHAAQPPGEELAGDWKPQWRNVPMEGIDRLGSWVMKRHLELYREAERERERKEDEERELLG